MDHLNTGIRWLTIRPMNQVETSGVTRMGDLLIAVSKQPQDRCLDEEEQGLHLTAWR